PSDANPNGLLTNDTPSVTWLQLQEHQKLIMQAIDQAKHDSEESAQRNLNAVQTRLSLIEQSTIAQRDYDRDFMQKWLLVVLGFVGGFALISLVGMVLIAVFLLRAVNRFTEATARVSLTAAATPSALLEAGNANL